MEHPRQPWFYFDGNAVSALWDWHTKVTTEGKTGDPRSTSPFSDAVLSDFSLDELITIPIGNAYKKHLALLAVFPDIPVLLPLEQVDLAEAERDRSVLVREPNFLSSVAALRARAVIGDPVAVDGLKTDIGNKKARIDRDVAASRWHQFVPKDQRVDLDDVVTLAVNEHGLHPESSSTDFFSLCRVLFQSEMARLTDRSSTARKGASRQLNQQIDYYHLSYIPFVDGFVTEDATLRATARALCQRFRPSVKVYSIEEYHRHWIRSQLLAT